MGLLQCIAQLGSQQQLVMAKQQHPRRMLPQQQRSRLLVTRSRQRRYWTLWMHPRSQDSPSHLIGQRCVGLQKLCCRLAHVMLMALALTLVIVMKAQCTAMQCSGCGWAR
jgi:hypothetical protein